MVVPFLVLVGVGWILVLTGFCVGTNIDKDSDDDDVYYDYDYSEDDFPQTGPNDRDEPTSYMFWIVIISGPLTIFTSLLHAVLWKPLSHVFGGIASFLVCLFLTGLGMVMYYTGKWIDEAHISDKYNSEYYKEEKEDGDLIKIPWWFAMEFAGALIATVFMTIVLVLVNFYDVDFQWPFKSRRRGEVTYFVEDDHEPNVVPPAYSEDPNRSDIV